MNDGGVIIAEAGVVLGLAVRLEEVVSLADQGPVVVCLCHQGVGFWVAAVVCLCHQGAAVVVPCHQGGEETHLRPLF